MGNLGGWRNPCLFLLPLVLFLPLLISVSKLHSRNAAVPEATPRIRAKKSDHLVLGPAAGQGLPGRLQCDGFKATSKIQRSVSHQKYEVSEDISFVTVYTIYSSPLKSDFITMDVKLSESVTVGNITYSKVERSMAILNIFINFIQVSMPRSSVIVLTDPASKFTIKRNNARILPIQGNYSRGNLMLQRIRSYIEFLEIMLEEHLRRRKTSHFIFTDSDIAVVDDLGHVFLKYPDFHLALTFRNNKDQPVNSGFFAVRGTPDGMHKAIVFLQEVLEVYSSKYMKASRMLGDQLALAWVIRSYLPGVEQKFRKHEAFSGDIKDTSVLFLPCAVYNWTPPEGAGQFHGMPLDVQVIHFKGSRKRLMLESWNFYNSTSSMSDMLCLILKSGRTKYDF